MPYFSPVRPSGTVAALEMVPINGGIGVMGSHRNHQRFGDCKPRLVSVDGFSVAPTCVTVGLQREVMGQCQDKGPDNLLPACFSHRAFVAFAAEVSRQTGRLYGLPFEVEWEFAARTRVKLRQFMAANRLNTITDVQAWVLEGGGYLGEFVPLGKGEQLTLGSRLFADPKDPQFVTALEGAHEIICWSDYATASGALNPAEAYYSQQQRGPVRYGPPNPHGLYDMTGGIWEHCADVYDARAYKKLPQENPHNAPEEESDPKNRVLRGGSWDDDGPDDLRAACRYDYGHRPGGLADSFGGRLFGPAQDSR